MSNNNFHEYNWLWRV